MTLVSWRLDLCSFTSRLCPNQSRPDLGLGTFDNLCVPSLVPSNSDPVPTLGSLSESGPDCGSLFNRKCPDRTFVQRKSLPGKDYSRTHSDGPERPGPGTESLFDGRFRVPSRLRAVDPDLGLIRVPSRINPVPPRSLQVVSSQLELPQFSWGTPVCPDRILVRRRRAECCRGSFLLQSRPVVSV